jgi:hypothetical protein
MRVSLPSHSLGVLALGTWLVYIADRILDGLRADVGHLRPRHHFYAQHRRAFILAGATGGGVLLWLIFSRMDLRARHEDTMLSIAAILYFLLIHRGSKRVERWLPKELAVGILFASASTIPAWSRLSSGRQLLLPTVVLFAALCSLNCVAIEAWENGVDTRNSSQQNFTTNWTGVHLKQVALTLATLGLLAGVSMLGVPCRVFWLDFATSVSALLLLVLHSRRNEASTTQLRVAADLALLTPLFVLPLLG